MGGSRREGNSDAVAHEAAGKAGLSQEEGLWGQRHQSQAMEDKRGGGGEKWSGERTSEEGGQAGEGRLRGRGQQK